MPRWVARPWSAWSSVPDSGRPQTSTSRAERLDDGLLVEIERPSTLIRRSLTLVFRPGRLEIPSHSITIPCDVLSLRFDGDLVRIAGHRISRQWRVVDPEPLTAAWSVLQASLDQERWSDTALDAAFAAFVRTRGGAGRLGPTDEHLGLPVRWTPDGAVFALRAVATTRVPGWSFVVPVLAALVLIATSPFGAVAFTLAISILVVGVFFLILSAGPDPERTHLLEIRGRQLLLDGVAVPLERVRTVSTSHGRLTVETPDQRLSTEHLETPEAAEALAAALTEVTGLIEPTDTERSEHREALMKLLQRTD